MNNEVYNFTPLTGTASSCKEKAVSREPRGMSHERRAVPILRASRKLCALCVKKISIQLIPDFKQGIKTFATLRERKVKNEKRPQLATCSL